MPARELTKSSNWLRKTQYTNGRLQSATASYFTSATSRLLSGTFSHRALSDCAPFIRLSINCSHSELTLLAADCRRTHHQIGQCVRKLTAMCVEFAKSWI